MAAIAHAQPGAGLWGAWLGEPFVALAVIVIAAVYLRGRQRVPRRPRRDAAFLGGLGAVAFAVASPLDHLSTELASAHMAQHLLLIALGAPLLVVARPFATLARGAPRAVALITSARRRIALTRRRTRALLHPGGVAVAYVGVLWAWHSPALYDAAVRNPWIHGIEHALFLGAAVLLWRALAAPVLPAGGRVLLLFAVTMQGVVLAVLLVFANVPWYDAYVGTTAAWGLDRLTDQQLAGALMWVPGGAVYVGAALLVVAAWLRDVDRRHRAPGGFLGR